MEESFYVKNSPSLNGCFLIIGVVFLALGVYAMLSFAFWIGLFLTVVFAIAIPIFIFRIFDKRPRITIDREGITDRTNRIGRILWDDIIVEQTSIIRANNNFSIGLKLREPKKYLTKLSKPFRALNAVDRAALSSDINLNLGGTDTSPEKFTEVMGHFYRLHQSGKQF